MQSEENKEANKGLEEYQEKLKHDIKIHEPKKPRQEHKKKDEGSDDEFEEVKDDKKREAGRGRGRGRGDRGGERGAGRGGRGGFNKDDDRPSTLNQGERKPRGEKKEQK